MLRNLIVLFLCVVLALSFSQAFGKSKLNHNAIEAFGKAPQEQKLIMIAKDKYIYQDGIIRHKLTVVPQGIEDTLYWYDATFTWLENWEPIDSPEALDTVIQDFKLIPDPAFLMEVRGVYGEGGGLANFFVWEGRDNGASRRPGDVLANKEWNVTGSPSSQLTWEMLDFRPTGSDTVFLPWSSDPDPANRPNFVIGYICSGTAGQGGGVPDIYLDCNPYHEPFPGGGHSSYTLGWYEPGWWGTVWQDESLNPLFWAEWVFEVIVNYYKGTSPFVNFVSQLNDTWNTSGFEQVAAELVDIDGTIAEDWLFYQKNSGAADSVKSTSVTAPIYYYDIPGTYAAGDTITYWVKVTDNDDKTVISAKKSFLVLGPQNPTAPILVVFNGLLGEEANLDTFWTPLLDAVIKDSLQAQYEVWDVDEHRGIDKSIINYASFKHALCLGYSMNAVPVEEYGLWKDFVETGNNILVASNDYLFEQVEVNVKLTFVEGDFIYDIFGVGTAKNDPADNDGFSIGDEILIGIPVDPISENWYGNPLVFNFIPLLDTLNWNDYASAASGLTDAGTVFVGVISGEGNGTRNVSTYGGKGVYLPFNLSALVDDRGGTYKILDDAYQLLNNILEWFSEPTGIDDDPYTQIYSYELKANYPNPFNPITTIEYSLRDGSEVTLIIYNALGEKVKTLVNDVQTPRKYQVKWDGTNDRGNPVSSGVYIYKLTAGDFTKAHKMILMK